jgi:hypothetical protein
VLLPIIEAILYRAQSGDCRIVGDLDIVLLHFGRCVGFENGQGHAREVLGEERHVIQSILGLILKNRGAGQGKEDNPNTSRKHEKTRWDRITDQVLV